MGGWVVNGEVLWEFHVILFGMEGVAPREILTDINMETAAGTVGNKEAASKHSQGRMKMLKNTLNELLHN